MKVIINNKSYNTDKTRRLGKCDDYDLGDGSTASCTVFRKRTGEYFALIEREGVPGSISPLSFGDAKDLCGRFMPADEYDSLFGAVDTSDPEKEWVTMCIRVPKAAKECLEREVDMTRRSRGEIIGSYMLTLGDGSSAKEA